MKKRINTFLLFVILVFYARAQTITITNVIPTSPICAGSQITVNYTVTAFAGTDNFTIELGNFGTFPGTTLQTNNHASGARSYSVTIPPNTPNGNYRIRVRRPSVGVNSNQFVFGEIKKQEITIVPRSTTWCAGSTQQIDFNICGSFNATNDFTIEMSNAAGSFAAPATIGTLTNVASGSGTASVTIPTTAVGEFYKIRMVSNSPLITQTLSTPITIVEQFLCNCTNEKYIIWQAEFGGSAIDQFYYSTPTPDGGFLFAGESTSGISGNKTTPSFGGRDIWVVKTDATGVKQWETTYGGTADEFLNVVIPTNDGGYLLGGRSTSGIGGNKTTATFGSGDYWIVKIDATGNKIFDRTYGGNGLDQLFSIVQTADDGFLLGGTSESDATGNKTTASFGSNDFWIIKIDAIGTKIWENAYGGIASDNIQKIITTADGYILAGQSLSGISGNKTTANLGSNDYWIVKINFDGLKQWENTYGGNLTDDLQSAVPTADGGFILAGYSASGVTGNKTSTNFGFLDYWIIKINNVGTKLWEKSYGGNGDDKLFSIIATSADEYILGGNSSSATIGTKTSSSFGGADYWIIKIDDNGNEIRQDIYGGLLQENLQLLIPTSDDGYLICGESTSAGGGNKTTASLGSNDYWLVKVAPAPFNLSATARSTTICAGNTLDIDYSIASCYNFKTGNNLKVELSDAAGNFTSATTLLTQATVAANGTLNVNIPITATGEFYKIRLSSSLPIDTVIIGSLFTIVKQSQCNCDDETVIDWQASFGGTSNDILNIIIPTADGGYLLGGYSNSAAGGNKTRNTYGYDDYWIVKIDANGTKQWDSIYGGTYIDQLTTIIPTKDGGYLLGGTSSSSKGGNKTRNTYGFDDYWIVKIDANGTKQWDSIYGGNYDDALNAIIPTNDGGFLLGGSSASPVSDNKMSNTYGVDDYWIVKINANGTKLWDKNYGGSSIDLLTTIIASSDGGYIIGGISRSDANGNKANNAYGLDDYWIVKINANGTKEWDSTYGGTSSDWLYTIIATSDNGYLLGGYSSSLANGNKTRNTYGLEDYWLVKIDANGTKQWDSIYGGTKTDVLQGNVLVPTLNGNFLLGGYSHSDISGNKTINSFNKSDYWVVEINENGTKINEKVYGGYYFEYSSSMIATQDGGYLIGGYSASSNDGNKTTSYLGVNAYWLVKVAPTPFNLSARARTSTICAGSTLDIDYSTASCNNLKTGNNLKVELSDVAGNFTSATTLLTHATVAASGTLNVTIPSTATGEFYKIRMSSSLPIDTVIIGSLFTVVTQSQCNCSNETVIDWQASFGGTGIESLQIILPTADGGYLLGGYSNSAAGGNKTRNNYGKDDYWIVKIDANGTKQWDSIYGGTEIDKLNTIIPTNDGGYLLGGNSFSPADGNKTRNSYGQTDYWIVKIDANGTKQWDSIYGGTGNDDLYKIIATSDGGYLLAGYSSSSVSGNKSKNTKGLIDYWVVKIDENGTKQWDNNYGGTKGEQLYTITASSDGGYILGGMSQSVASGNKTSISYGQIDYWIVKIDAYGNKQWDSAYGGTSDDWLFTIVSTLDNGYLLGGYSSSLANGNKSKSTYGQEDYWIVKIDANGTKQWDSTYGGRGTDVLSGNVLLAASDGNFLLGGYSFSNIGGNKTLNPYYGDDYWVVTINENGTKINEKLYGGLGIEFAYSMIATKDGGYLIGGRSSSDINGNKTTASFGSFDYWIVKTAPAPKITPISVSRTVICSPDSLQIFFNRNICGVFKTGNKFYVQLSDSLGDFTSPTILDSITNIDTPNSIIANLPSGLTESSTYKIRIVSSFPAVVSDTVSNIKIFKYPNLSILAESCSNGKEFSAIVPDSSIKQWQRNGVDIGSATASSYFPTQFGNYRLRTFNAICKDTSDIYSVVPANVASTNTCTITDGLTRFICDNTTGEVIAKIVDVASGNVLGSTTADMYIDASVQYYQTQPYVQRHYDITPASSGAANITLYVPQSEFDAYNISASTFWPHLPSGPADVTNMNNLVISQYHGTSVSHLPGTYSGPSEYLQFPAVVNTWNSATNMWEVKFNVSAFSGIFLHTQQNSVLPVELFSFSGKYFAAQAIIKLSWQTTSELHCAYFEVERMKEDGTFEYVGTVNCHGTTNLLNNYNFDDSNYIIGNNFYRLKQVDDDGKIKYYKIIKIFVKNNSEFQFQTFTDNGLLSVISSEAGNAALYDNNQRLLKIIPLKENDVFTTTINYLAKGIYFIRFENEKNTKTNKIFVK